MQAEQTFETIRSALGRHLSPLVAWIPDVTTFPRKRQVAIGVIASVVFHLLIVAGLVIHELAWPFSPKPPPPVPVAPLQVLLVPKPHFHDEDPLVKARRQLLDAKGLEESAVKPADAQFEDDKDRVAGSELPPTGILPLPSQQGRTDLPGHDFRDQDVRLGVVPDPTPETLRPPDPTKKDAASAPPAPAPLFTPQPLAPDTLASADKAKPVDNLPDPAKVAKATPPPLKMGDKPETTIAMLTATPRSRLPATPAPPALPATAPEAAPKTTSDRFHENMRKTGVEGNIVTKGKNGVNAVNSPMGRYKRRLSQQIESLWTLKRPGENAEVGTVRVSMKLREDGTVQSARVLDDGGSPHHTEICLQVIRELRPEKMPPEAEPLLDDGIMEITFSFTIYGL